MLKVAFVPKVVSAGDSVRGIGVNTNELIKALSSHKDVQIVDNLENVNVVHYTKFRPFFVDLPFTKPAKKVVLTIHDLIPLIYPDRYSPGIKGNINFQINKYLIRKNVDEIITISETSKKDICRFLEVDPKKVHVIYLAPRSVFKKIDRPVYPNLPKKFVLYVGDINYNKNIPNLIRACEISKIPLVIVGKQALEWKNGNLDLAHPELSHLKDIKLNNVICLGFIEDPDLVKIYNMATVFVQASFYEGFGFGVLDALACGTPIVASKTQALVEILGTSAGFVNPNSPEDIARGIERPNKNVNLPREYSWAKNAEETINVYR